MKLPFQKRIGWSHTAQVTPGVDGCDACSYHGPVLSFCTCEGEYGSINLCPDCLEKMVMDLMSTTL